MMVQTLKPKQALNKAFLKVKPNRTDIEAFKANLITVLDRTNDTESEEFHKNLVSDFLKNTYYKQNHFINTKGRNDLVIHNGQNANSTVGVIIEAKKPTNKAEMLSTDNINKKAFQELVLYYLRERITLKNLEVKHLVATNINEWFIFDATLFERLFAQNKNLVKQFNDFEGGRLADTKTDFFYKQVAEPFIDQMLNTLPAGGAGRGFEFTYFNIQDFQKPLRNTDKADDNSLIALFKLLSPEHLLKLPFTNDSNSLDKRFYSELLHIIGLTETKEGSKKLIERNKAGERHTGTILEDAIIQLDSLDKISRLEKSGQFGATQQEKLFNVALELSITWINRILFLKLLEAQLITYHKGDKSYSFLNLDKIKNYDDLNSLFFQVLARKYDERNEDVKKIFEKVPYLNSSLFEPTEIEQVTLFISNLKDDKTIPIFSQTVLKDQQGKKRTGNISTLQYLFAFLDAYDFGAEGGSAIQEDNKTLINASVLGLIFEKINGYKDGSFFTPGFITMYMCRETIRKAVVQKFSPLTTEGEINSIEDIYKLIPQRISRKKANELINSLKICDPAVGSGHFLVSALNEIISVKNDLKILEDKEGKSLHRYEVAVVNDELIVTDEDGELFEYNPKNKESQRIQETLFHEKQTIIENCLFGVDINPNSVKICRLRLWIELLKSSYYKTYKVSENLIGLHEAGGALETLPNIDINIKCGNSLVSRFAIDADLKQALKKSKWTIESYRLAVATYRNAESKEQKREMERLIAGIKSDFRSEISRNDPKVKKLSTKRGELFNLTQTRELFDTDDKKGKDWNKKVKTLSDEVDTLEQEIESIKANKIFENAFEWRFEFPEVLNDDGDFVGFDVVIGNPPYIRQEEFSELKPYLKTRFKIYHSIADLLTYFVELSYDILKPNGNFQFIISNKFTRANYGQVMRKFILENTTITHYLDFSGIPVFDEATVDAAIVGFDKKINSNSSLVYANVTKENIDTQKFELFLKSIQVPFNQKNLTEKAWAFENQEVLSIKKKVESQGIPLKDWDITINYGLKTGLNDAFVIDGQKKKELIDKDPKSIDVFKPLLRGRDIYKWRADFADLWLIYIPWHFPLNADNSIQGASEIAEKAFKEQYPAIYTHLEKFKKELSNRNKAETGIRYEWYALQRFGSNYWRDFDKPKIIYPNMTKFLPFFLDFDDNYFHNDKSFHMVADRIYWLSAFLNSKLFKYCFQDNFPELLGGTRELRKVFFDKIPVKQISDFQEIPFKELVINILSSKKQNPSTDTTVLESQIDQLVYQLYELTEEEIKIIENA